MIKKRFLSLSLIAVFLFPAFLFPADALSSKVQSRDAIIEYLDNFCYEYCNADGQKTTLTYNLSSLTSSETKYLLDYIEKIGIKNFERLIIRNAGIPQNKSQLFQPTPRALISKYVVFPENGRQTYTNREYQLVSFEQGHTMECSENISITVLCQNGIVIGVPNFSFNLETSPQGSYVVENMHSEYSSNSAGLSVTYTVTKTIEAGVGDFSFPILQYSQLRSAALLLLRQP